MSDTPSHEIDEPVPFQNEESSESQEEIVGDGGAFDEAQDENITSPSADSELAKEITHKQAYDIFLEGQQAIEDSEEKLRHAVAFMEQSLSTKQGTPHFKSFWDARNVALQLFKENANAPSRADLWAKYAELSKEARRLKEMLDEQSAFAAEQIEIAIGAIEAEQESTTSNFEDTQLLDVLRSSRILEENLQAYIDIQTELSKLNTHAGRVTALRKELIRTEMRVRQKNKFFQRLSAIGDKVFPRRKELIKEISQRFSADVDSFVEQNFKEEGSSDSLFFLREEIKALQNIAKQVTLNTHAFKYTRMRLSESWDLLKLLDKERKKVRAQQKATHRHNVEPILQKLAEISAVVAGEGYSHSEVQQHLDAVIGEIQSTELGRDELKILRDEVGGIRKALVERLKFEEQERIRAVQERDMAKKAKVQEFKNAVVAVLSSVEELDADVLAVKKDELSAEILELPITKLEKLELERSLKPLKDAIVDKKEKSMMALSEDDRNALQQLKEILKQRKERRSEIKGQLEAIRKSGVSSGLDLEKAMAQSEQIAAEKERLEKINSGIKEIEDKIAQLQKKP